MRKTFSAAACLVLCLLLAGCGITAHRTGNPGFARFTAPEDAERVFQISLGSLPLLLARTFVDDGDKEASMALKGLKGVRVFVYEVEHTPKNYLAPTLAGLHQRGWESVVAVRDSDETTHVLLKFDRRQSVRGMVVLAMDGSELVVVNLIGKLNPELFNEYMDELSIDAPSVSVAET